LILGSGIVFKVSVSACSSFEIFKIFISSDCSLTFSSTFLGCSIDGTSFISIILVSLISCFCSSLGIGAIFVSLTFWIYFSF